MHFFHLIQQSASHIYHSALPLSPKSSSYSKSPNNTKVTEFHGQPDGWGIVVRTIAAGSKRFTCMAAFGHKIAVACDDGTVSIYDSVTGVLRLSLRLADPVRAIRGSPDGSILFCAHETPSITVWDIQTGGLIHTFVLERSAEEIAVSLNCNYLACGLSDGSVEVWKVSNTMEGAVVWTTSPVTCFCWLEPEEQLAVSTRASVRVWDIVTGTVLHNYTHRVLGFLHPMVYSQKFNELAIMVSFTTDGSVMANKTLMVIDVRAGKSTTSHWTHQNFSCFAFTQTAGEFVCGLETHGLQLFNVLADRWMQIDHPDTMISVSSLQNGTVVANFVGSGIQLLSLDGGYAPSQQPTISPLTMDTFDQDRIIAILPARRDSIVLLELPSMSQLLKIPVPTTIRRNPANNMTILCASLHNLSAVYYFEEGSTGSLQLWKFHEEVQRWTVEVDGVVEIGGISPTAVRLVTLHTVDRGSRVCVWNTRSGQLDAQLEHMPLAHPLDIKFTSETEFCLYHNALQPKSYTIGRSGLTINSEEIPPSLPRPLQKRGYFDVDDACEWVVSGSTRVCWIPTGYIRSIQPNYRWAGSSLVMVGEDGMLRTLTFP